MHTAEVEIDPETGTVRLAGYAAVDDFGNEINPMLVDGQVHGGVGQGAGQALMEQVIHDPDSGQLMTGTFLDYTMPRAADFPEMVLSRSPTPCLNNPLGLKGCGEAGAICAPPAIMIAIMDALAPLGVTHRHARNTIRSLARHSGRREGRCMIRLTQTTMDEDIVPVIDFAPFREGGEIARRRTADEIDRACRSIGFLVIGGHGIPQELIDRAFAISRTFFAQSTDTKMQAAPPDKTIPRGYQAFASKRLAATLGIDTPPTCGSSSSWARPRTTVIWWRPIRMPKGSTRPISGRKRRMAFARRDDRALPGFERLGSDLMTAFALGLGLPEDYFASRIDRHFSTGTTNLYPALQTAPEEGQLRTGMHTDFGSLTLLLRSETVGGLQVQGDDGDWYDVPDIPGTLVVNIGDMMARWTNDQWRSTLHRVANPPTVDGTQPDRQSMAYFLHPNYDSMVEALPGCVTASHPAAIRRSWLANICARNW